VGGGYIFRARVNVSATAMLLDQPLLPRESPFGLWHLATIASLNRRLRAEIVLRESAPSVRNLAWTISS